MGLTRWICKSPVILAVLVLAACAVLTTWTIVAKFEPKAKALVDQLIGKYDAMMPEITLSGGKASIKEPQPYYINKDPKVGPIVVIDTRDEAAAQGLELLKDVENGVALTRDYLTVKDPGQTRILPLRNLPDFRLNSQMIKQFVDKYYQSVIWTGSIALGLAYILIKLIQALILAILFYLIANRSPVPPTYGQSVKVAIFALIPPVLVDSVILRSNTVSTATGLGIYLLVYVMTLLIAWWDYTNSPPARIVVQEPINP